MRISDWSTDVCSADLLRRVEERREGTADIAQANARADVDDDRVGEERLRRIADAADARAAIVRPQKADHIVLVAAIAPTPDRTPQLVAAIARERAGEAPDAGVQPLLPPTDPRPRG